MDEFLIELLKKAYRHEFFCYLAFIKTEGIKPFMEIKVVPEDYRRYFEEKWQNDILHSPTPIVYQKGQFFICSDDLNALFMYREKKWKRICCTVLGEPTGKFVFMKGKPFFLPAPTVEFLPTKE